MKKLILLHAMLIGFTAATVYGMEQDEPYKGQKEEEVEESKVPTLQELALQKVHETDVAESKEFQTYPDEIREAVKDYTKDCWRSQLTRFSSIMCSIPELYNEGKQELASQLIKKIPSAFLESFLDTRANIKSFIALVNMVLPEAIKKKIVEQFAQEVHNFLTQSAITTIEPEIRQVVGWTNIHLPIELERADSEKLNTEILRVLFFDLDKMSDKPEFLIPISVMQGMQKLLIDAFIKYNKYSEELPLLQNTIKKALSNIERLIDSYKESDKELYNILMHYFTKLKDSIVDLSAIHNIAYRYFIWDKNNNIHIRDTAKKMYRREL